MALLDLCSLDVVPCYVEELEYIQPLKHTQHTLSPNHTHIPSIRIYNVRVYVISVVNITGYKCLG